MRRNYVEFINPNETISHLRDELYLARHTIIDLMPEEAREILTDYHRCESREERAHWQYVAADRIIDLAKPIPDKSPFYLGERAYCPLCGGGSTWGGYESGFALGEGLRRHLLGWGDNRKCRVMEAAIELAREYWHHRFHEADEAEEKRKREQKEERKRTETVYRTAPDTTELIDDGISFGRTPRDESEMAWAEKRLAELGFEKKTESNIRSYTDEHDNFVVYADPRSKGEIKFTVYRKSFTKGKTPRVKHNYLNSFSLQDSWKHDLRGKYESRLARITT